jgi:superfamily II DNA helicase RecQ
MTLLNRDQLFESLLKGEITLEQLEAMANTRAWLRTLHTRQLMNMRYTVFYAVPEHLTEADVRAMILSELDTREHLPMKD